MHVTGKTLRRQRIRNDFAAQRSFLGQRLPFLTTLDEVLNHYRTLLRESSQKMRLSDPAKLSILRSNLFEYFALFC